MRLVVLLLSTLVSLHFGSAAAALNCKNIHRASSLSSQSQLARNFQRYIVRDIGGSNRSFLIEPRDESELSELPPSRIVIGRSRYNPLVHQLWSQSGEKYQFFDVGIKNLEGDALVLNRLIAAHMLKKPRTSLRIDYSPARLEYERQLLRVRWAVHDAVLKNYFMNKVYLTFHDNLLLKIPNIWSNNNDVLGLLRTSMNPETMSKRDIQKALLITLQISYYGEQNYLRPTFRGLMFGQGHAMPFRSDKFPFEYRLDPEKAVDFRRSFVERFDPRTTCEFTRYVKFDKNLPDSVRDAFLFEAFRTAIRRGMRTAIASTDPLSARRFRRYGFEVYSDLPTRQDGTPEYLLSVDLTSPEFQSIYYGLQLRLHDIDVTEPPEQGGKDNF